MENRRGVRRVLLGGSRGSASLEWIGVLVVVSLVVGSVGTAAMRSAPQVQEDTRDLVCRVLAVGEDGACEDPGAIAAAPVEQTLATGPVPAAAVSGTGVPPGRTMALVAPVAAPQPTLGGTRAATPDAGVVPMTECAGPTTAPPVTTSEIAADGGVVVTTTTIATTVCAGPAGGVRDCTKKTETVTFTDGYFGPQDFDYQMQCGAPRVGIPVVYPGVAACVDPVGGTTTSRRACFQPDGQVSSCTGIPVPVAGGVGRPVWICTTGSLPAYGFDACSDLGDSSAMCTVADTVLRCFQPRAGAAVSDADYARCSVPGPGDPLTDPVVVEAVEAGADADAVVDACDAVVAASPAATAEAEADHGAAPQDDELLLAELDAAMDMLDQYLLASTGYDPGVPAQREAYQAQLSGARTALQDQPAGSPLTSSEEAFDAAATDQTRPPSRKLPIGGGEPGARCRSNVVWLFVVAGGLFVSQGERLGMSLSERLTFAGVWTMASAGAFWLREQYESRMREYNSVPGAQRPYATVARQGLQQLLTVARAQLASFGLPAAAPAEPMQADDWAGIYPADDIEMQRFNPARVNQGGQVWQTAVNAQGAPEAPVALFRPPPGG